MTLGAVVPHEGSSAQLSLIIESTPEQPPFSLRLQETRLGSSHECECVIPGDGVLPVHARILRTPLGYVIAAVEGGSVTVEGEPVSVAPLQANQRLKLGSVRCRVESSPHRPTTTPALRNHLGLLVGASAAMQTVYGLIDRVARSDATVLIFGETGTGKNAAAQTLHLNSPRASGPFVVFDCAAVSRELIESELFGHEKGAFTGAISQRIGCLERAHGGTLLIDETDDLAMDLQPKLLRALEDRRFQRVGGTESIAFDTRVIAASKRDLWQLSQAGRFREDLYFRLSVFALHLPPLRERMEDLPFLMASFGTRRWEDLPSDVQQRFLTHRWPGNVRELRNAIERLERFSSIPELKGQLLRSFQAPATGQESLDVSYRGPFKNCKDDLVRRFEREYLVRLLESAHGNVARAAREAELDRKHLYSLLHKHELVREPS